jgi:hypothetical protein
MVIDWPQGIFLGLLVLGVGISLARFGEQKRDKYSIIDVLVAPTLNLALLWWGGFFS